MPDTAAAASIFVSSGPFVAYLAAPATVDLQTPVIFTGWPTGRRAVVLCVRSPRSNRSDLRSVCSSTNLGETDVRHDKKHHNG